MSMEARQTLSPSNTILPRNHEELDLSGILIVCKIIIRFNTDENELLNARSMLSARIHVTNASVFVFGRVEFWIGMMQVVANI